MGSWAGFFAGTRGGEGVEEVFGCLLCGLSATVRDSNCLEQNLEVSWMLEFSPIAYLRGSP